jgi:hypothetical protein
MSKRVLVGLATTMSSRWCDPPAAPFRPTLLCLIEVDADELIKVLCPPMRGFDNDEMCGSDPPFMLPAQPRSPRFCQGLAYSRCVATERLLPDQRAEQRPQACWIKAACPCIEMLRRDGESDTDS